MLQDRLSLSGLRILRIGPVDLTCGLSETTVTASSTLLTHNTGTLIPDTSACIPTVTDNAFTQGLIDAHEVGISFEPTTTVGNTNGELAFGGVDTSKFTGPLEFV